MRKPFRNPASRLSWLWALLPLLLAAALAIPLLDVDAFNGDEPVSLVAAGILSSGPPSLADVWENTAPRHPPGWAMLLSIWGPFVGWSEFAIRALSLFIGLLTLAWVYRTGRNFFTPAAGLFATLLLSASVFHLAFMARAELYAPVALWAVMCIWFYWRVALCPQLPGRGTQAGLLLGSICLLYSHYLGALLLPALGLFHLFFVPKHRRWWRPVFLFGLALLTAAMQIPLVTRGLAFTEVEELGSRVLIAPALLSRFIRFMTNGLVAPSPPFSEFLLLALLLVLALVTLQGLRRAIRISPLWLLAFVSLTVLATVIAINEYLQVIVENRIRYLMPLWPLTALLAGAGLWRLARSFRRLATVLLALWLISGTWLTVTTDFRYELGFFFRSDIHRVYRVLIKQVPETELLMIDKAALWTDRKRRLYSNLLDQNFNAIPVDDESLINNIWRTWEAYPSFWLLYLSQDGAFINDLAASLGLVQCELVLDEWGFTLERLARSGARCASDARRLEFANNIRLTWSGISLRDELLRFEAGLASVDDYLLANYSLAVHVINPRSGERVAQGDVGVGPGAIVPLRSEIDISALPPGDYEVRVALYDWRTGARLSARDLETDEVSDMHTLHHFRLG